MTEISPQFFCKGCPLPLSNEERTRHHDEPIRTGQAPGCEGPTYILAGGVGEVTNIHGVVEFHPNAVGRQALMRFCGLNYEEPPVAEDAKLIYADRSNGIRLGVVLTADQVATVEDASNEDLTALANRTREVYDNLRKQSDISPKHTSLTVVTDASKPLDETGRQREINALDRINSPAKGEELWAELNAAAGDSNIADVIDFAADNVREAQEGFISYAEQSVSPYKQEIEAAFAQLASELKEAIGNNQLFHDKLQEYLASNQTLANNSIEPIRHNYFKGIESRTRGGHPREVSVEALKAEIQIVVDKLTNAMQQLHAVQEVTRIRTHWLEKLTRGSVTMAITDAMSASTSTHFSVRDSSTRLDGLITLLLQHSESL